MTSRASITSRRFIAAVTTLMLAWLVTPVFAQNYTYTTLVNPLDTRAPLAVGINNTGQIVGWYYGSNPTESFLYSNGQYTPVNDPLSTGDGTSANGISNSGTIVGWYYYGYGLFGFSETTGSFSTLPEANGGVAFPSGVNNNGQVVGYYLDRDGAHGFLYSGGTYTILDDPLAVGCCPLGVGGTYAQGINDRGDIVGFYVDSTNNPTHGEHGFLYRNGQYETLDDPLVYQQGPSTRAEAINNKGQIVGYYNDSTNLLRGFVYSNGQYTTLNVPSATYYTYAFGINDNGQVVGYYTSDTGYYGYIAQPIVFAGTPGSPNCHGTSVSALTQKDGSLAAAATDLGFASVSALQNAIKGFCGS
jgi:probable HAF family extracellular repeat protein